MARTTDIPFRQWPWRARVIEKLYRWTHGGHARTLVLSRDQIAARDWRGWTGTRQRSGGSAMEEPKKIILPRTGRHFSAWGHGHTCSEPEHDGPCVCYCGVTQPYENRGDKDAVPQDREG